VTYRFPRIVGNRSRRGAFYAPPTVFSDIHIPRYVGMSEITPGKQTVLIQQDVKSEASRTHRSPRDTRARRARVNTYLDK